MAVDESVKVVVTAEDKASGVLNNIGSGAGKLGAALKSLGTIAVTSLAAGAAAVTSFAISSVSEFIEAEKQMTIATNTLHNVIEEMSGKQLEALNKSLGATGSSFVAVQKAMEDTSKAALQLGFDDEAASISFAKLFQVTKDAVGAQKEMKIAMDLAAFSGRSLEEATQALIMVHAGGTRVLKEFGIEVKDNTTVGQALALVQDAVAGSAAAMADTTAGKLSILSQSWGNLKEMVGATLAEAITPFIDKLSAFAQDPSTQAKFQELATKIAGLAKELGPVVEKLVPALIQLLNITVGTVNFLGKAFLVTTDAMGQWFFQIKQIWDFLQKLIDRLNAATDAMVRFTKQAFSGGGLNFTNKIGDSISNFLGIGRASGGPVSAGSPYIVGEQGPEWFVPSANGQILPNGRGLGSNVVINITGTFLSKDAAAAMANMMMDELKMELRM